MPTKRKQARDGFDWFGRSFKGINAGDVFAVPLPDGTYAFGRQMNAKDGATIAEFFRARRDTPDFDPEIIRSGRLFSPVGILITDIAHGNRKRPWQVIHKDRDYYPEDLYGLKFHRGTGPGQWQYFTLDDEFQTLGRVSDEDVRDWRVPSLMPQHADRVVNVIMEKLKKQGL